MERDQNSLNRSHLLKTLLIKGTMISPIIRSHNRQQVRFASIKNIGTRILT
jgi:hypothetical protein